MAQTVTTAILGISNERVRNLVRGAMSARSEEAFKKTMESIHRECDAEDAPAVGHILQLSPFAKFSAPTPAFGEDASAGLGMPFYTAVRLDLELAIQSFRFEGQAGRLVDAIGTIARLNESMLADDMSTAERLFQQYRGDFGVSLVVAMKAASLRNAKMATSIAAMTAGQSAIEPFLRPRRQVVMAAFEDTSDNGRDYMRIRRFYMNFVHKERLSAVDAAIVGDVLSPLSMAGHSLASRLEAYGRRGLVDVTAFLHRAAAILRRRKLDGEADLIESIVPRDVWREWSEAFQTVDGDRLQDFVGRPDQFFDLYLHSHLPAWSEYPSLLDYRLNLEEAIGRRLDGDVASGARSASQLIVPRESASAIADSPVECAPGRNWPFPQGGFARTVALIASVEEGTIQTPCGEDLSRLLDRTVNVAGLLSVPELDRFLPRRREDYLYEYMRTALLFDAEGGVARNHALRKAMQQLVQERYGGDILAFIADVDSADGHVSQHLFHLCSEPFLTTLYDLYKQADDVMEAQTRLLEWQGDRRADENAVSQAKSLRLLIRLRKVRGSIEETRLYVDPLRLMEWMHETLEDDLRALQPLAEDILSSPDVAYNPKDILTNTVQPRSRLLRLLDQAYEEFCTNKLHGASSYIGRRVRHGTFHGHLVVEMQPTIQKSVSDFSTVAPRFGDFLRSWAREFDRAVSEFARDRIHIRSKSKPRGLIIATLDDPDKASATSAAAHGIAIALREKLQFTQLIAIVLDYCWLLIDVDLTRAREAIEDLRRDFVIDVEQHLTGPPEADKRITECVRDLNGALSHRFEVAKTWLTRPTNFSPRASLSLLIEAVLDEVRQRYEFTPRLVLPSDYNIDLIGHRFHFIYDALYILVDNAAKYGRPDGGLGVVVEASVSEGGLYIDLAVVITSCFREGERDEKIKEIDAAMAADIGDAMECEGRTGLRKLRGLMSEAKEITGFEHAYDGDVVRFTLRMRYPWS